VGAAFAFPGCNFVLDLEAAQCQTTSDCLRRGAKFAGTTCVQGSCVASSDREDPDDGTSSVAGNVHAGKGGAAGGGAVDDVQGGAGGDTATGCLSNSQCVADNNGEPYACLEPGQDCTALKTEECPLVFGDFTSDEVVYFGALLDVPASGPLSQMSTLNVKLAVDEVEDMGGLPSGQMGHLRALVGVVCKKDAELVPKTAAHLIQDLGVSAVLAHLPSNELKDFFVEHALPEQVFVLNPGFADNTLTSLATDGLFWHMIGDIRDVAPAYAPVVQRAENYINPEPRVEATRVALVIADRYAEKSIADSFVSDLVFNGKSVIDNGDDFFSITVPALADEPDADYAAANAALLEFAPHVVVAVTREELIHKMLPVLEGEWSRVNESVKPIYVVPTALAMNLDLLNYISFTTGDSTSESKRRRIVGVNAASAEDMSLYNDFLVRFRSAYPEFENAAGFENFYDAIYLLTNAIYAAGAVSELGGPDIARGMQRVTTGNVVIEVGPTHLADGFAALATGGSIQLLGTMGPADFDPGTGARRGNGSVYCVERTSTGGVAFLYDVLRYDRETEALIGETFCFDGF
jgi:ABC-type branched-subunit amino acid transport system substrate-binding protein